MFKNVGKEIKSKAESIVVVRSLLWGIVTILPVIAIIVLSGDETVIAIAGAVWLILLAVAYFHFREKAMLLYAQGELTENVMIIKNIISADPELVCKPSAAESWNCNSCGTENKASSQFCYKCGEQKPV